MSINNFEYDLAKIIQQERWREAEQARLVSQATQKMRGYEFFFRSQLIFDPKQAGRRIYVIVEGEVAILQEGRRIEIVEPGHYLVEATLPAAAGLVAVGHTDCRLVAIDEVMLAVLAQCPPEMVVWLVQMMSGLTRLKPVIRWPASLLARRSRQPAGVYPVVRAEGVGSKE